MNGSIVRQCGPVTLSCIAPEARDLLDRIMEEYQKHYESGKKFHKPEHWGPDPDDVYRFAYWLVRWSGLIEGTEKVKT